MMWVSLLMSAHDCLVLATGEFELTSCMLSYLFVILCQIKMKRLMHPSYRFPPVMNYSSLKIIHSVYSVANGSQKILYFGM